jgi:hypothetical protein
MSAVFPFCQKERSAVYDQATKDAQYSKTGNLLHTLQRKLMIALACNKTSITLRARGLFPEAANISADSPVCRTYKTTVGKTFQASAQ